MQRGKAADSLFVSDVAAEKLAEFAKMGVLTGKNEEAAAFCDVLILAVKPNIYEKVLPTLKEAAAGKLVISIAAGITADFVAGYLEKSRIVRIMPNTPALVGEGMTAIQCHASAAKEDGATVEEIFSALGKCVFVTEAQMDGVVAVSGSGPAYAYMLIDAMAAGGVMEGLTKKDALLLAAQTVLGAAKMVLETGEHPAVLTDNVCSPGGTTIAAVAALEAGGLRRAVMAATRACAEKSAQLKK